MTNPVALTTTIWGNGDRRALLLHGLTSAASTWWRTGGFLGSLGYIVVAPDLRGHGKSPAGDNLSIESHRDDVLLMGSGWDVLVGHSLGGAIAAAVLTAAPDFAKRLILEDPAVDSAVTAEFIADSPEPLRHPTTAAVAAQHPSWDARDVELKVEALIACGPDIAEKTLADAAPWDVWPDILASQVPTLIVAADIGVGSLIREDREAEVSQSGGLIRFERIPGAGHSMHRDAFDRFSSLVERFLVDNAAD